MKITKKATKDFTTNEGHGEHEVLKRAKKATKDFTTESTKSTKS